MFKIFSALCLILLGIVSFLHPNPAKALAKFNTSYQIYYQVEESGKTKVKFVINQKNNLSVVYATEYGISINETKIEDVKVYDEGFPIVPNVTKSLNQTSISFPFANKVVGKDKNHSFIIEYTTTDITTKFGNTWQVDIPRLEQDENVTEQSVALIVPAGFPSPAYIDPKPNLVNGNTYYFSGSKVSNKSISAIFGKTQYYKGKITYHLAGSLDKTPIEIALPPDTAYQSVYYQKLEPKPISVRSDNDGNILAAYSVKPSEKLDITLDLLVKVEFVPKPINTQPSDTLLSRNSIWNYDQQIFNSPEIRNLKTPKSIYDFVSDKLKYDYEKLNRDRPTRVPAAESLINYQSAICTDFTDVFVSLARKAGIPARELEGFAISENPDLKPLSLTRDVLHAWPEYFDKSKSTWIQVDPTWGNTTRGIDYFNKLDFNHIVFAIHGESTDSPVPAGGYKNGSQSKDISFEPVEGVEFPVPEFSLQFLKQENNEAVIQITNLTGVSYYGKVTSEENDYLEKTELWLYIPPFSSSAARIHIKKLPIINKINTQAIIYFNDKRYESGVSLSSTSSQAIFLSGIGGFLAVATLGTRHLYLRRRKQKTSLYR